MSSLPFRKIKVLATDDVPEGYDGMNKPAAQDLNLPYKYDDDTVTVRKTLTDDRQKQVARHEKIERNLLYDGLKYDDGAHIIAQRYENKPYNEKIKKRIILDLIRFSNRKQRRAQRTREPEKYLDYTHSSYRLRSVASKRLGYEQTQTISELEQHEKIVREHGRVKGERREQRAIKTEFKRVVKYRDKEGKIHKRMIRVRFRDKTSLEDFVQKIREGRIVVGMRKKSEVRGEEEAIYYDRAHQRRYEIEPFISFYGGS